MTVRTSADVHFDKGDVWRRWHPEHEYGPYGVLKFGHSSAANIYFRDPEQVDEVIAELVALRNEMTGEAGNGTCDARPYPAGSEGDDGTECMLPAGHDGPHDDVPPGSGEPDWCPASTVFDEDDDHFTAYCDRKRGHQGSHRAPGPDEGSEVAWSDEAAAARGDRDEDAPAVALSHSADDGTPHGGARDNCSWCAGRDETAASVSA